MYYVFAANATNVVFNNFDISGYSSSDNEAKNTDGWDTYRSSDITISNSVVNNGDGKSYIPLISHPLYICFQSLRGQVCPLSARSRITPSHEPIRVTIDGC